MAASTSVAGLDLFMMTHGIMALWSHLVVGYSTLPQDRQTVWLEIEALHSKSAVFSPSGPVKMVGVLDCSALRVESFREEEVRINGMHILRNWYTNHSSACLCTLSMDTGEILETNIAEAYCVPGTMWSAEHQKSLRAAWFLFLGSLPFGVSWANETNWLVSLTTKEWMIYSCPGSNSTLGELQAFSRLIAQGHTVVSRKPESHCVFLFLCLFFAVRRQALTLASKLPDFCVFSESTCPSASDHSPLTDIPGFSCYQPNSLKDDKNENQCQLQPFFTSYEGEPKTLVANQASTLLLQNFSCKGASILHLRSTWPWTSSFTS